MSRMAFAFCGLRRRFASALAILSMSQRKGTIASANSVSSE
jgi:hypothetical protein